LEVLLAAEEATLSLTEERFSTKLLLELAVDITLFKNLQIPPDITEC